MFTARQEADWRRGTGPGRPRKGADAQPGGRGCGGGGSARQRRVAPVAALLRLPLVARSPRGEYLGVSGRSGQPLSLARLAALIRIAPGFGRRVDLAWERAGDGLVLRVAVSGPCPGLRRILALHAAPRTTPSGNPVAELRRLTLDGAPAPRPVMLALFRQIRENCL